MVAGHPLEVADLIRAFGERYRATHPVSRSQSRVLSALEQCRTAALGGHLYECDHCGRRHPIYNSCRNRHCPKCQGLERAEWLAARQQDLLPVPYFHLVFTVPEPLRELFLENPAALYDLLFQASRETLQELAADRRHLGAEIGVLSVLHTWTQTLTFHPHVHAIVTGGGLSLSGRRWVPAKRPGFLFPVRVLGRLFRGKFLAGLRRLAERGSLRFPRSAASLGDPLAWTAFLSRLYASEWNVYCKPPFAGPQQVLTYLARYTHRIAIANSRLVALDGEEVIFRYKDRAADDAWKQMRLPVLEFLRRFLQHVLPDRFVRLRYSGLLAHRHRRARLQLARRVLDARPPTPEPPPQEETWQERLLRLTGFDATLCPHCRQGHLLRLEALPPRRPSTCPRAPP